MILCDDEDLAIHIKGSNYSITRGNVLSAKTMLFCYHGYRINDSPSHRHDSDVYVSAQ